MKVDHPPSPENGFGGTGPPWRKTCFGGTGPPSPETGFGGTGPPWRKTRFGVTGPPSPANGFGGTGSPPRKDRFGETGRSALTASGTCSARRYAAAAAGATRQAF